MARVNRREVLAEDEVHVVHCVNRCVNRCVRRGFLCGDDPLTGRNYDHRRQWILNRLEFPAGVFGVEVLSFAVLSNHFHVVLRTRPDAVADWSDDEVARRWWLLFPQRRNEDGSAAGPTEFELRSLTADKTELAEHRKRLSADESCRIPATGRLDVPPTASGQTWGDSERRSAGDRTSGQFR